MAADILVVDDEADIRELVAGILEDEGYEARLAGGDREALDAIAERRPSLVLLDIWLQGSKRDGLEVLEQIRQDHEDLPVVMISGHGNIETAVQAIKLGAYDYIEKPFQTDRLLLVVERAVQAARLQRENRELRERAGPETTVLGDSHPINAMRSAIEKVATTGSRVMISGPAGSGKEVVARALHSRSRRDEGPFVVLNAAMMAPERVEVELFGTENGGNGHGDLSDAASRVGVFEQAHGGTLFLDEVADMPLETQGKVLRVLVDQTFQRVGGSRQVKVDVRVICSTTRDLLQEIELGRFREDLYHRLNVVPIRVPSLRERPEDIPLLVEHFMQRSAGTLGLPPRSVAVDALSALQSYEWPGNVRQLRNVVERLVIMAPGDSEEEIGVDALPQEIVAPAPTAIRGNGEQELMTLPLREAREVFEREYLIAQINRFGGNISRTAEFVGMERSALHRKLKLLGVGARGVAAEG